MNLKVKIFITMCEIKTKMSYFIPFVADATRENEFSMLTLETKNV